MTDSAGRSASLSRDKTIPAAQGAQHWWGHLQRFSPQCATCSQSYVWLSLTTFLYLNTKAPMFSSTGGVGFTPDRRWILTVKCLLPSAFWWNAVFCYCLVLFPHPAFQNGLLHDELILVPTIALDRMMSSLANRGLASLPEAHTHLLRCRHAPQRQRCWGAYQQFLTFMYKFSKTTGLLTQFSWNDSREAFVMEFVFFMHHWLILKFSLIECLNSLLILTWKTFSYLLRKIQLNGKYSPARGDPTLLVQ